MTALLFNQRVDLDDPGQGVAIDWLQALASRVDRLIVLTHHAGRLPRFDNVVLYSAGRERGWSEARRAWHFVATLRRILKTERPAFCLSHMVPVSTVLAGPFLNARDIPILQWYTHRGTPWELKVATRFARHILTATPDSFRLKTPKVVVTGHGIPTERFTPAGQPAHHAVPRLLTVGRLSPIKNLETIVDAIAGLRQRGLSVSLDIAGAARVDDDVDYEARLKSRIRVLGIDDAVVFRGAVPRDRLIGVYRDADIFVHACDSGLDKAGLEAMSCGVPLVSSSTGFRELLNETRPDLIVPHGDADALADRLETLVKMPAEDRRSLGMSLRALVQQQHDLSRLMDRILVLGTEQGHA